MWDLIWSTPKIAQFPRPQMRLCNRPLSVNSKMPTRLYKFIPSNSLFLKEISEADINQKPHWQLKLGSFSKLISLYKPFSYKMYEHFTGSYTCTFLRSFQIIKLFIVKKYMHKINLHCKTWINSFVLVFNQLLEEWLIANIVIIATVR